LKLVDSSDNQELRFWAATSVVKLCHGDVDDRVTKAIEQYQSTDYEGPQLDLQEKQAALQQIAKKSSPDKSLLP
jgi:hypothetical protein